MSKRNLLCIYSQKVHSYMSCVNIGWARTNNTRIICNEDKLAHAKTINEKLKNTKHLSIKYISNLDFYAKKQN